MTSPAYLRAVATPEDELARLFAEEDAALRNLAEIRQAQGSQRKAYADKHGLLCLPGMATLRRLFG